jgi:hypothetical protein
MNELNHLQIYSCFEKQERGQLRVFVLPLLTLLLLYEKICVVETGYAMFVMKFNLVLH